MNPSAGEETLSAAEEPEINQVTVATVTTTSTTNTQTVAGACCNMGQNDTIGKIELNSSFVLSSEETNCKNDIQ